MTIDDLKNGQSARILKVGAEGSLKGHFLDMGIIPGAVVKLEGRAPMGDPLQVKLHGYSLSLRSKEASQIEVTEDEPASPDAGPENANAYSNGDLGRIDSLHEHNSHPGLGEEGKYHRHEDNERALPKDTTLRFALVGQQNCGKTTLFNLLTGANQHVGNFPGVTVDRKDGTIKGHQNTLLTDLPGIYSLSTYTTEETVARDFLLKEKPHCIINIVDATNIERNLYLTLQLIELGIPMVLALNMMDEVKGNGGSVRVNEMERILGIPVVPISAAKGQGIEELVSHALHIARYRETPAGGNFYSHMVETGQDAEETIARRRYDFIYALCERTVVKPEQSKEYKRSLKIDKVLTGKWTAIPIFITIMALIIWLTIDILGAPLQELLSAGIDTLSTICGRWMQNADVAPAVQSLVVDAVFGGVGAVVSFVPVIIILFFFLSLLEDSGYMARIAYVTDGALRKIGLSGRSIVPLLIGLGCSVPAVMASRTLPSARDRKATVLLTPFMSCSAKLPIYAFFSAAFFPGHGGLVLVCLYLLSIAVGIVVALVNKKLKGHKEASPFVMELPVYRLPRPGNVGHLLWDKTKDFLQRAFTVIFLATLAIWLLQTFDPRFNMVQNPDDSMLAAIAGFLAPAFAPLGLGDWRIVTAFISGFLAKESVVSTVQVLGVGSLLTVSTAVPMLVFCLLYTPCVAAIASVKRELGHGRAIFMVIFQCAVAWAVAFAAYRIALLVI